MKIILFCLLSILILPAFSQEVNWQKNLSAQTIKNDTVPTLEIIQPNKMERQPIYVLNGQQLKPNMIRTINPKMIDSIHVENKEIKLNGTTSYGKVSIKMKAGYQPQFVSLNTLKLQYTKIKNEPVLFMIDDDFIKEDYDQYIVDLKYILKIIVDKIDIPDNKSSVNVIRLLTRTEKNIKESKEIRLRGTE